MWNEKRNKAKIEVGTNNKDRVMERTFRGRKMEKAI